MTTAEPRQGVLVPEVDIVPPGPERPVAVAHGAQSVLSQLAHATRHTAAARAA